MASRTPESGVDDGDLADGDLADGEYVDGEYVDGEFVDGGYPVRPFWARTSTLVVFVVVLFLVS
ncbi:hypothetical protein, partial [Actinophytocola sp.]|uniref:hypothetical protein n=1 Tax=Actinophytocola sp. TaxID=1872138 RepID=UPI00389989EA